MIIKKYVADNFDNDHNKFGLEEKVFFLELNFTKSAIKKSNITNKVFNYMDFNNKNICRFFTFL